MSVEPQAVLPIGEERPGVHGASAGAPGVDRPSVSAPATATDLLRARLGELARLRRARTLPGADPSPDADAASWHRIAPRTTPQPWAQVQRTLTPLGVESFLPGGERTDTHGRVWVHERLRSELERGAPSRGATWGTLSTPPAREEVLCALATAGLGRALFLDLETCGLSTSAVFLAGLMHWNGSDFVLRQYFARHYGEEAALVAAVAEEARGFEFLVTFNGKSYDVPFLRGRGLVHRVDLVLPRQHVDLLHPARRRWRWRLPDCRLQTLERHVCRRHRSGDVGGAEIPARYHAFVRDGDPWPLAPVFHHNLLDVMTMAEVLTALCAPEDADERLPGRDRR